MGTRDSDIERICRAALERQPDSRAAFLVDACAGDDALRHEVESLLTQATAAEHFLQTPAFEMVARGVATEPGRFIGRSIGRYQVVSLLGTGGMGEVYRARDPRLNRDVALKVLPEGMAVNSERRARFDREAQAVAALNHPNIVTIHSVEQADGLLFLTMELVDGKTLAETMTRRGWEIDRILVLAIPLADAINAAHERGITHRDLKPTNIMVNREGRVKILDFGLAKLRDAELAAGMTALPTGPLTDEGRILGTVAYMSPEQAEGKSIDHRSDIFSLGIILYELATGRRRLRVNRTWPCSLRS